MTDSQDTASPVGVCPYLGTVHDPTTPCMFVTTAHRCFSGKGAGSISAEHQAGYCISGEHMRCARFVDTGGVPVRARSDQGDPTRSRLSLSPRPWLVAVAVVGLAGLLTLVGLLAFGWWGAPLSGANAGRRDGGVSGGAAGVVTATPGPAEVTQILPAAGPTETPTPWAFPSAGWVSPTSAASSEASPEQTATPGPQVGMAGGVPTAVPTYPAGAATYVVKAGDSLWSLSVKFGVSMEEIIKANGLTNRDFIWTGERLVIPRPR